MISNSKENPSINRNYRVNLTFSSKNRDNYYEILMSTALRRELELELDDEVTVYNQYNKSKNSDAIVKSSEFKVYDETDGVIPTTKYKRLGNLVLRDDLAESIGLPKNPFRYLSKVHKVSIEKK